MDASCCEFKKLMSQVLSDLKYMSNQVIKKTDILLNEVESLNVNSVDALSQSIITLFERINLNITDFSTTFNNALVKYKKAEEIKKSESTEADPNLAFPTEKEEKIQVDEDELPEMAAPVPAEKTDIEVVKIKEERDDSDLDEPTLLNFDVPVDSKANELKKALDELCSQEVKKEVTNDLFDSTSFDFDDMNDQLVAEMEKGETHQVENASLESMLPTKSCGIYKACFQRFLKWCTERIVTEYSEDVLLEYFSELAKDRKSSSLWSHYSMLKMLLKLNHNVDISKCLKLRAFLKKKGKDYKPKKTQTISKEQFDTFVRNAPDEKYLVTKVVLIFGVLAGTTCQQLANLRLEDVEDWGSVLRIKIPKNKNKFRSRIIEGDEYLTIYRKYASLRPPGLDNKRFFLKYQNGKCYRMVMGIHKLGNVAKEVALYLKIPNWQEFTGHSLRTSGLFMPDLGDNLKRQRKRRSIPVDEESLDVDDFASGEVPSTSGLAEWITKESSLF